MKNKQLVYRMGTFKARVDGAYINDEEAIKGLADQFMRISHCGFEEPSKRVMFSVKVKLFGKKCWINKNILRIHPFNIEHIKINERSSFAFSDFKCEVLSDELKYKVRI